MISGEGKWGTYRAKKGFPANLPASASLLRIANIVRVEFELQQVICDTLESYVLINPLSIVCVCLVLIICACIPTCGPRGVVPWFRLKLTHFEFSGRFFA
jgi:hypothetical protein